MVSKHLLIGSLALAGLSFPAQAQELEAPVRLMADGELIDVEIGHAAPYLYDLDGDGKRDLLVGQFGGGKLRIYRNTGTEAEPVYSKLEWFRAGGELGTVPSG